MNLKKCFILLVLGLAVSTASWAKTDLDTVKCTVYFKVGKSNLDPSYRNNKENLSDFFNTIEKIKTKGKINQLMLISGASPEGNNSFNDVLSNDRMDATCAYLNTFMGLPCSQCLKISRGENWEGLVKMVQNSNMPNKDKVLSIIKSTPKSVDTRKDELISLDKGKTWNYMLLHFFPDLRSTSIEACITYEPVAKDTVIQKVVRDTVRDTVLIETTNIVTIIDTVKCPANELAEQPKARKPFYMAVKTNMLYDLALVPNIGVEFYLGKRWTIGANWEYAWWNINKINWYHRIYGGELNVRKYFGKFSKEKPLQGHHLGIYGQILTWDFEFGGKGYMGGTPLETLWQHFMYGAGIEYGYSLPIAKRLNLDFSIGFGYLGGNTFNEYVPSNGYYRWVASKKMNYWGPTKAEISLVWLIGRGNYNQRRK